MTAYDEGTVTEWEVAWFPPGEGNQSRVYSTEDAARRRYAVADSAGHLPILARRDVTREPWRIVLNAADARFQHGT